MKEPLHAIVKIGPLTMTAEITDVMITAHKDDYGLSVDGTDQVHFINSGDPSQSDLYAKKIVRTLQELELLLEADE